MKKSIFSILVFAVVALISTNVNAQSFKGLDKSPMDQAAYPSSYKVTDKVVKVTYSRPQLKGRPVAKLAPNDAVWRTGANEAAEITFYKDMMLGKTVVPKGTYTLFTIPGEKSWTTIISKDTNVWGSYSYNEKNDVARVNSQLMSGEKSLEAFSIAFEQDGSKIAMYMGWGTVRTKTLLKPVGGPDAMMKK